MENPFLDQKNSLSKLKMFKIGVHSGKGGVGKTFVAVNVAYSLAAKGYKVGLVDADIDCPNVPKFLSVNSMLVREQGGSAKLEPVVHNGVKIVSTALFNPGKEDPIIIRGPIKHRMLLDFLQSVNWGDLDYLVIDLPPGTADVPLSAMQLAALDTLLLVTTPTKEAILDTTRALNMAKKLNVLILGLLENMSGEIFGSNAENIANSFDIPYLGSIPLSKETAQINENAEIAFLKNPVLFKIRDNLVDLIDGIRNSINLERSSRLVKSAQEMSKK
ncbi:P-loop NTPase [Candidatus Micrarchaeota archaeon]|nr:P-loop NTPase [Candidatus Micrarchaeota archaeon]